MEFCVIYLISRTTRKLDVIIHDEQLTSLVMLFQSLTYFVRLTCCTNGITPKNILRLTLANFRDYLIIE